jgi:hypothetical protein
MSKGLVRAAALVSSLVMAGGLIWGCENKESQSAPLPADHSQAAPATTTGPAATEPGEAVQTTRHRRPVDREDAPDAPRALPKTYELRGWAKSEPVRVFPADGLQAVVTDPPTRNALGTFHLHRAARCAYEQEGTTAAVVFIEAATPEDAFGVFSIMTTRPGTLRPDGTIRVVEKAGDAIVVSGWQGSVFSQLRCTAAEGKLLPAEECDELLAKILFNVASADPPWLMRAVRGEKIELIKLWMVRSTAALAVAQNPVLNKLDPAVMDKRLGLKGGELLAVALVQVSADEPPNMIWLAHYERTADARAAADRYQQARKSVVSQLDENTILDDPKGPFLAGSWTADAESKQKLLPKLHANLPD